MLSGKLGATVAGVVEGITVAGATVVAGAMVAVPLPQQDPVGAYVAAAAPYVVPHAPPLQGSHGEQHVVGHTGRYVTTGV